MLDNSSSAKATFVVEEVSGATTTDQYASDATAAGADQDFASYAKLSASEITVSGDIHAWQIDETWQESGHDYAKAGTEVFFVQEGYGYAIYFDAALDEWDLIEPTVSSMLETLRYTLGFIAPTPTPLPTSTPAPAPTPVPWTMFHHPEGLYSIDVAPGFNNPSFGSTYVTLRKDAKARVTIFEFTPTNDGLSEFSSWVFDWRQNTWESIFFEAEFFAGYQLKSGLVTETFVYRRQAGAEYCVERYVDAVVFIGAKPFELLMHACVSAWADYEVEFDTMLNTFRRAD